MREIMQNEERGAVLLESLLAVVITLGIVSFTAGMVSRLIEDKTERAAARYLEHLHEAVEAYTTDERALARHGFTLQTMLAEDASPSVVAISVLHLKTHGFLPPGFPERDAYGASAHIALSVFTGGAHEGAGLMLRVGVFMEGSDDLVAAKAARLNAHARKIRGGHLRREINDEGEAEVIAVFAHGGRMDAASVRALHGGEPVAGHMLSVYEKPIARSVQTRFVNRAALARALERATSAVTERYEEGLWETLHGLTDSEFWNLNAGRNMRMRDTTHQSGTDPAVKAFRIQKHICPSGYAPTVQLYPDFVSDYDVGREVVHRTGASRTVPLSEHLGGPNFRYISIANRSYWSAVGIFRTKASVDDAHITPSLDAPLNLSQPLNRVPAMDETETFYYSMRQWRQSSRVHDEGDDWVITHLPVFWTGNHADNSRSLVSLRSNYAGVPVMGERGGEIVTCAHLAACEDTPYPRWFYAVRNGHNFLGVNGLEDGCSIMRYYTRTNRPGLPHTSDASFCQYLRGSKTRLIRKCVPDLTEFKRGLHVVLKPPAR